MSKSKQEQYNSLIIPDELYIEDFKNAKVEDAFQFTEWYFAQTKDRINVLKDYISQNNSNLILDYTDESLVKLWIWFEDNLEMVKKSNEEIEYEKEQIPQAFWSYIQNDRISHLMIEIAIDISYYFVDMLISLKTAKHLQKLNL